MKSVYLREPERPFILWKWLVFGPLFLLMLNFVDSRLGDVEIIRLGIVLGYLITIRMIGTRKLARMAKLIGGIGLALAISSIASMLLLGFCMIQPSQDICVPNHLGAHIFGNFAFPLIVVVVWVAVEIVGSFWKTVSYVVRYWKR